MIGLIKNILRHDFIDLYYIVLPKKKDLNHSYASKWCASVVQIRETRVIESSSFSIIINHQSLIIDDFPAFFFIAGMVQCSVDITT